MDFKKATDELFAAVTHDDLAQRARRLRRDHSAGSTCGGSQSPTLAAAGLAGGGYGRLAEARAKTIGRPCDQAVCCWMPRGSKIADFQRFFDVTGREVPGLSEQTGGGRC